MHVLLIEDDARVAAYVAKALREEGHLVDHRADGRAGLLQASSERYDVIVLDLMKNPKLAGNFFTIDLGRTQQAFQSVPWVRHASVQRVWPDRLAVKLEEHRPAAFWGENKLVNTFGEVFEANLGDVEDDNLPTLHGPEGSAVQVLQLYGPLNDLVARLDTRVNRLTLSARGSWHADLDSGARVELGRGDAPEVLARVERFIATWNQVIARYPGPLEYADLRHHNGYAVRIKGITTTVPESRRTN